MGLWSRWQACVELGEKLPSGSEVSVLFCIIRQPLASAAHCCSSAVSVEHQKLDCDELSTKVFFPGSSVTVVSKNSLGIRLYLSMGSGFCWLETLSFPAFVHG